MPASARRELARALEAACDAVTFAELVEAVLDPLQRATSSSGAILYRFDAAGTLQIVGGNRVEGVTRYVSELFDEDPIQKALYARGIVRRTVVPRRFPEIDWSQYRRTAAYLEFYRPNGIEDILVLTLADLPYGSPGTCGLLLTRSDREPEFDRSTPMRLTRIRPLLCRAARRIARHVESQQRCAVLETAIAETKEPIAIFNAAGVLLYTSGEAEAWREEATLAHLSTLAARAASCPEKPRPPGPTITVPGPRPAQATTALVRCAGETFVRVVLAPIVRFDSVAESTLTESERTVAQLVAKGLTNAAIGVRLCVSVETVRTHVRHLLAKVGAATRTEAAAILRGESRAPEGADARESRRHRRGERKR